MSGKILPGLTLLWRNEVEEAEVKTRMEELGYAFDKDGVRQFILDALFGKEGADESDPKVILQNMLNDPRLLSVLQHQAPYLAQKAKAALKAAFGIR
jgi:hypothetical protein